MYGLQRIIQIDGFVPGVRTVVNVDGHSILDGTNGAGKSTTLRLLSFFYGGDPSQMDIHSAGRDPFIKFYLPRQTSIIVFEYTRESGTCCAVVYRHKSGMKHVYRFLEGGFTQEGFSQAGADDGVVYCKGHELKMHWRQMDLTCSQQIEIVTDYRAIIQNDSSLINRLSDSRSLRQLAGQYCIGSRTTHMRYIDRICSAIGSQHGNMERMKDMIADIMVEDGVDFPASPIHKSDANLAAEILSLRNFEKEIGTIKGALSLHRKRQELEVRLGAYSGNVRDAKKTHTDQLGLASEREKECNKEITTLVLDWDSENEKLRNAVIEAEVREKFKDTAVTNLFSQYDEYENIDMEQVKADFENLSHFKEEADVAEGRYLRLIDDVKAEESELHRLLNTEHRRFEKKRAAKQSKIDGAIAGLAKQEIEHSEKKGGFLRAQLAEQEGIRNDSEPESDRLRNAVAAADAQASGGGPVEDERSRIAMSEHQCALLEDRHVSAVSKHEHGVSSRDEAKNALDAANGETSSAKKRLAQEEDRLADLHRVLYAEDGSWLKRLREYDPRWAMTLGKVVSPKLLQRKDLDPQYSDAPDKNFFGWTVNLDAITTPLHAATDEQLIADYAIQEDAVQRAEAAVEQCEKVSSKASKKYKTATSEADTTAQALSLATAEKDGANRALVGLRREIDSDVSTRRENSRRESYRLSAMFGEHVDKIKERVASVEVRYSQMTSELHGSWSIEKCRLDDIIDRLKGDIQGVIDSHKQREKDVKSDFEKQCSANGIDEETLRESKKAKEDAEDRVESVRATQESVDGYSRWLKESWSTRDELGLELERHRVLLSKAEESLDLAEKTYRSNKKLFQDDLSGALSDKRRHQEKLDSIDALRHRYDYYLKSDSGASPAKEIPFESLISTVTQLLDDRDSLRVDLLSSLRSIDNKIESYGETQVTKAWSRAKADIAGRLDILPEDMRSDKFILNLPDALQTFVDDEFSSIRLARIESLRAAGKGLTDFFEKLSIVHSGIKAQSGNISRSIKSNMNIEALARIELLLSSRVEELDYWGSLDNFSVLWKEWREEGTEDLPDSRLLDEMSQLISALQGIKSGHHLRDYFDLHILMVENGRERIIKNDAQLIASTSTGLRYLALCSIFIAIARALCPDREVNLHWPVDELGQLHSDNITRLFGMLNKSGITMVGGFPSEDPNLLRHFKHRQVIDFKTGIRVINIDLMSLRDKAKARIEKETLGEH